MGSAAVAEVKPEDAIKQLSANLAKLGGLNESAAALAAKGRAA
jgi:hypothetical protein